MAQPLLPGTRWIARRGKHSGNEVQIDHVSDISVFYKTVGGGENWGNQKTDGSRVNRLATSSFRTLYAAKGSLVAADTHGGVAFRRTSRPRIKPIESELPAPTAPLSLNGYIMSGTPLSIEVLEITPDMAAAWLERGGRNRKVSERLVSRLAASIRRGEWLLTGDSIKLDENQIVLDGQHRLHAIAAAGIAVTSLVVRNVGNAAQDVIDTGRPRQAADVLAMHGHLYGAAQAACARLLMIYEHFGRINVNNRQVNLLLSNAAILGYVGAHPELIDAVRAADLLRGAGLAGGTGTTGAIVTVLMRKNEDAAREFVGSLKEGANLGPNSPILRLRNRLQSERRDTRIGTTLADRERLFAVWFRAWNAWRHGDEMTLLIWRETREPFPEPM